MTSSQFLKGEAYAQARANETGRAYFVTGMGHVWLDSPSNRRLALENGGATFGGFSQVFNPQR